MSNLAMPISMAKDAIELVLKAQKVPLLKGPPGLGKSAIHRQIAEKYKLLLIDVRLTTCEPPDLNGFPSIDAEKQKSHYLPMDLFPLEGDPIPEGYNGWLIFFDEITSSSDDIQVASYKIILDRLVGQKKLHDKCLISCAGNGIDDGAIVNEMSSALISRLIHLNVRSDHKSFRKVAMELGFDSRIRSYLEFKPSCLNNFSPDKLGLEDTYACERTWHFLSDLMKELPPTNPLALYVYSGTVGEGVAREFIAYCKVYHSLPSVADIASNPEGTPVPTDPGTLYAMTGSLGENSTKANIGQLIKYINRMPLDFQVVTLRQIIFNDRSMMYDVPAIARWIELNSVELF